MANVSPLCGPGERRFGAYATARGDEYLAYFKRSFVRKRDGAFAGIPRPVPPRYMAMQYSVSDAYLLGSGEAAPPRELDVVCTLRVGRGQYPARARVLLWARDFVRRRGLSGFLGEFDTSQRNVISEPYLALMRRARVVITCNPGEWEGDFRTWEAVASGALVFMDRHYAPTPHAFEDGVDAVVYDNGDRVAFDARLEDVFFNASATAAYAAAADRGLDRALAHHRAISRVDWLLRSALAHHPTSNGTREAALPDDDQLGGPLLAAALRGPPDPPPRAREPVQPTADDIAALRSALFVHPDGRVFEGKRATTAAAAFARAGWYRPP